MNTRVIRLLLPLEAVTFVAAALIHFGVIAAGYKHEKAGVAESVIAAVLLTGGILAWLLKGWTRKIGLAAQAFASTSDSGRASKSQSQLCSSRGELPRSSMSTPQSRAAIVAFQIRGFGR